jgi:hypothetical protein
MPSKVPTAPTAPGAPARLEDGAGEPMTPEKLRELYPEAVAQIEADAKAEDGEPPADDETPPADAESTEPEAPADDAPKASASAAVPALKLTGSLEAPADDAPKASASAAVPALKLTGSLEAPATLEQLQAIGLDDSGIVAALKQGATIGQATLMQAEQIRGLKAERDTLKGQLLAVGAGSPAASTGSRGAPAPSKAPASALCDDPSKTPAQLFESAPHRALVAGLVGMKPEQLSAGAFSAYVTDARRVGDDPFAPKPAPAAIV